MASLETFLQWIVIICVGSSVNTSFVSVECKAANHGLYGQRSVLECVLKTSVEVTDANILVVVWRKVGVQTPLLVYNKGERKDMPGVGFAESRWNEKNMNVSLLVTDTKMADAGDYECKVLTDCGDATGSTSLSLTAKYSTPTINSMPEKDIPVNTDVTLFCNSSGGYPEGQIHWSDGHGSDWTSSSVLETKQRDDGLFSLSSKLTLLAGSNYSMYRCSVHSATGGQEGEATFQVAFASQASGQEQKSNAVSKIVAPLVVIGSLIVGLLFAVLFFRKRARRDHQPIHTHDPDVEAEGTRNKEVVTVAGPGQ